MLKFPVSTISGEECYSFFNERPGTRDDPDLGGEVRDGEDGSGGDALGQHGPRVQDAKVPPDDTRASASAGPQRAGLPAKRPEGGPHWGRARRRHGRRERSGGRRLGGDEVGADVGPW